ncbi:hypothetical protein BZA05DRAFT_418487 [Tricharina praecox]|uniref:uncharacterized protein n=1 Tax=Tricharina praecox TaxID=43433 RepID=UPI00221E8B96|nr:uncharacterized protein BZA05DRAFT_418487 [Tricharina praecox]KAI5852177.1 hypothetical protein BZA05DRAFT_418487 [Tricharina praecox]
MSTSVRNIPTPTANQRSDVQTVRAGKMDIEQLADIFSLGLTKYCSPFLWNHTTEQACRLPMGHHSWDFLCDLAELWPRHRSCEALLYAVTNAYNRTHADSLATATRSRKITADVGNIRLIGTADWEGLMTDGWRFCFMAVDHGLVYQSPPYDYRRRGDLIVIINRLLDMLRFYPHPQPQPQPQQ